VVYKKLREAILNGDLVPGERLIESAIADEIGASRAPVREAINRLANEGLVKSIHRRGTYISTLDKHDAWEVYTLRAALERIAFGLAPHQIPSDIRDKLQSIVDEMKSQVPDGDVVTLSDLDMRFHETIVRLAGHKRLLDAWLSLIDQIRLLSRRVIKTQYPDFDVVAKRHQLLLDVLCNGTEEDRMIEIEKHIHSVADRVLPELE
jgi:DNA-binding GntR family transcriptional regulator